MFGILQKRATVILGNPEIFKYPIQCRPLRGGGGDIFWNSPLSLILASEKYVLQMKLCLDANIFVAHQNRKSSFFGFCLNF